MYCIKCGVRLADTEKKCPLCDTAVYHPDIERPAALPLYPENVLPESPAASRALNGAAVILWLIPLFVCFAADLNLDGRLQWFGYVAGALLLAYVVVALPLWFRKPNPVIFVPCDFAAAALYLLYISLATDGTWFLSLALPAVGGLCLITTAAVTLLRYLRGGKLYVIGGTLMALGVFAVLVELLIDVTFHSGFIGWSVYPLCVLLLLGGLLIYLAVNRAAREALEQRLFF